AEDGIRDFHVTGVQTCALPILLFVVLAIYFVGFWHRGQTLAMKTWHIRVVDKTGRPLTRIRALARYALCWLWLLPPLAVLASWRSEERRVGKGRRSWC